MYLIGIALTVSAQAQTRMPKPVTDNLPGLPPQSDEYFAELRKAQAEQKAREAQAQAADVESNFYTGKPYDAEIGGYVFKYRNYSPEMQRWMTADPSGFPDGANNYVIVSNNPIMIIDSNGLTGKSVAWVYTDTAWLGYEENDLCYNALLAAFQSQYDSFVNMDNIHPDRPHYLDDGDIFKMERAGDLNALIAIGNNYTEIYIGLHGAYAPDTDTQYWSVGYNFYTDLSNIPNTKDWWGCYLGMNMTATDIMNKFQTATAKTLQE